MTPAAAPCSAERYEAPGIVIGSLARGELRKDVGDGALKPFDWVTVPV